MLQGSEETMRSLPIDDRLTIANSQFIPSEDIQRSNANSAIVTTEWGALSGLFPIDSMLIAYLRSKATTAALFDKPKEGVVPRISHSRIDELMENRLVADRNATFAKSLYLNLSTLSPFVS